MKRLWLQIVSALVLSIVYPVAAGAVEFRIIEFPPQLGYFQVCGISSDGALVIGNGNTEPMLWTNASGTITLGKSSSTVVRTFGSAISGDGTTVVGWSESPNATYSGWRWRQGVGFSMIPDSNGIQLRPTAVNSNGSVVFGIGSFPWRWTASEGILQLANVLGSQIDSVASCDFSGSTATGLAGQWGYRWFNGVNFPLTEAPECRAEGFCVSGDGQSLFGTIRCASDARPRCFVDRSGQPRAIQLSASFVEFTLARSSQDGSVAVGSGLTFNGSEGSILLPSGRVEILKDVLNCKGVQLPPGCRNVIASAVSGSGRYLAGHLITAQGMSRAWWADLGESIECFADFNRDCSVDFFDYLDFVEVFAGSGPRADFNKDGTIDFFDYLDFVLAFSSGC